MTTRICLYCGAVVSGAGTDPRKVKPVGAVSNSGGHHNPGCPIRDALDRQRVRPTNGYARP